MTHFVHAVIASPVGSEIQLDVIVEGNGFDATGAVLIELASVVGLDPTNPVLDDYTILVMTSIKRPMMS